MYYAVVHAILVEFLFTLYCQSVLMFVFICLVSA